MKNESINARRSFFKKAGTWSAAAILSPYLIVAKTYQNVRKVFYITFTS